AADLIVERRHEERNGSLARVIAEVRRDDLAVAGECLAHRANARAVVHAGRQKQSEDGGAQRDGQNDVPEAREQQAYSFSLPASPLPDASCTGIAMSTVTPPS